MEIIAYAAFFLTVAMTYAIICLGLNVQWGQTGLFNVGVAGFVGVGAYVSAALTTPDAAERIGGFDLPILAGWGAAALMGALLAIAIGVLTLRMRADYLAITTFGIAVALQLVFQNAESLTGGAFGLAFIPRPFAALQGQAIAFNLANLAITLVVVLALYLLLEHLLRSPWGRALRAVREDEIAAQALGKNPVRLRLQAFALGGAIMALAGAVQAHFIGFIAPGNYLPMMTFQVWAMLIVGGSGNNRGAILGAVLVWAIWALSGALISEVFPADQQARAASLQIVIIGVMLCIILLWRPQGILPEVRSVSRHLGHRKKEN
ncbi:branched-chain amino acid ABC transporter permease [uncultured Hoeflea sp.]|uniref:branched-chain amino acid ABC transporter permease n=1 Tax=uncultured Hoeflea sp. TaxID=538666 RepID=UPI00260866D0|nr:branched-chain amino acid ABC transporter permease [uncultured Hoeflea sp.]